MTSTLVRCANFLAFLPTAVFLATVQYHQAPFPERWAYAFYYAFVPAVLFAAFGLAQFLHSDKLWLGTNLWFSVLGSLTAVKAWNVLEVLAGAFKESGGFIATAAMGLIAGLVAPGSFVGVRQSKLASRYAWWLAGVACAASTLSYFTQGTRTLSITVPVLVFIACNLAVRRALRRAGEA
jgi:hypothetical protein